MDIKIYIDGQNEIVFPILLSDYKNELDRQYDYLENPKNNLYAFLMEDIKDKSESTIKPQTVHL